MTSGRQHSHASTVVKAILGAFLLIGPLAGSALGGTDVEASGQVASVSLTPPSSRNQLDTVHTLTAEVRDQNGAPVPGADVDFEITQGPNQGLVQAGMTDALTNESGIATFTYSSGAPGTDTIVACSETGGSENDLCDSAEPRGTAQVIWQTQVPCSVRATITGTPRSESLKGTRRADVIHGLGGNDRIKGLGGNDIVCGGDGNDIIEGGPGNDSLDGQGGADTASFKATRGVHADLARGHAAGAGNDTLSGFEKLLGSDFDDVLIGDSGNNSITSSGGDDRIDGMAGDDIQKSGTGNDEIYGGPGLDSHYGGPGDDFMDGGEGDDTPSFRFSAAPVTADLARGTATGEGNDTFMNMEILAGSRFADTLIGSSDDDTFYPLEGNDQVLGSGGSDAVVYAFSPAAVVVDLEAGTASGGDGQDVLTSIEMVVGSDYDDILLGNGDSNDLYGIDGDDLLDGREGDDYLNGGFGGDTCISGEELEECE